jgi:hypothetical protein
MATCPDIAGNARTVMSWWLDHHPPPQADAVGQPLPPAAHVSRITNLSPAAAIDEGKNPFASSHPAPLCVMCPCSLLLCLHAALLLCRLSTVEPLCSSDDRYAASATSSSSVGHREETPRNESANLFFTHERPPVAAIPGYPPGWLLPPSPSLKHQEAPRAVELPQRSLVRPRANGSPQPTAIIDAQSSGELPPSPLPQIELPKRRSHPSCCANSPRRRHRRNRALPQPGCHGERFPLLPVSGLPAQVMAGP